MSSKKITLAAAGKPSWREASLGVRAAAGFGTWWPWALGGSGRDGENCRIQEVLRGMSDRTWGWTGCKRGGRRRSPGAGSGRRCDGN